MITLLLAEDEEEAREGLRKFVPWDSIGIGRLEEVSNGLSAIDLCESVYPDILLTDVRMPKVDGIQLAFYIRERFPLCKIIFISGYSDKEYLKSAIRMGAVSYIEKPVDMQELNDSLIRAVGQCREDQKKREAEALISVVAREGIPLILQKLACGACYSGQNGEDCLQLARYLDIDADSCPACTLAVKLYEDAALTEYEKEYYRSDMIAGINSGAFRTGGLKQAACFPDGRTLIVHCFFTGLPGMDSRLAAVTDFLSAMNGKYPGKYVFTAVKGDFVGKALDIPQSFLSAQKLIKTLFYVTKGELHITGAVGNDAFALPGDAINEFDRLLQAGTPDATHVWLERLEASVICYPSTDIGYIKNIYFKLYERIILAARKAQARLDVQDGDETYIWQDLSKMETLHDITRYYHSLADSYFHAIGAAMQPGFAVQDVMEYIRINANDPSLSIRKIADYSHYDYVYLCTLFKKSTKMTINEFITKLRLEKAIDLLKDRRIRLHDITRMVGYSDPSSFTKLFRKCVGATPSEYREKHYP